MSKERLMLIDGNSLLHRAFHALPPLKTSDGIYTNGVYGFLTMLYKVLHEYKPDYIGVAFDKKAPTFRHKEFEQYKAGRAKTPDELKSQFPILKEVLDKLNIYRLEMEGFEADDIVGTLAKMGEEKGLEVIVVTGDKDYLQLVTENTRVLITKKGISNLEIYNRENFIDKYDITPEQFIDLKGLMGDKSDNIPGVPGVGEKTGIKLLKQFDSIENIYENIDKISGKKLKERLQENKQQALMSKKLVTIVNNIPIEVDFEILRKEEPNSKELLELYRKLEFKSLIKKAGFDTSEIEDKELKKDIRDNFKIIDDVSKVKNLTSDFKNFKSFCFKFCINGSNPLKDDIIGLTIKGDNGPSYYIDFRDKAESIIKEFKDLFEDENIEKLGHNLKEDILVLMRNGIQLKNIHFDTIIGQYLVNPSQKNYSIKSLADEYLKISLKDEEDILGKGKKKRKFSDLSVEERAKFFCSQTNVIFKLEKEIAGLIESQGMAELFYDVELPLIEVLADMEFKGFKVDKDKLKELENEFQDKIDSLTKTIHELAGEEFNINSTKQLSNILFDKLNLPPIKKTKTGYSTSAEVLEKLKGKHPIIENILEYRQIVKLKTTYVDGLMKLIDKSTNRIHSSFNQTITTTGRISSTEPNLQNIPVKTEEGRKIRKVFVAEDSEYVLVDADYSQIELRVLAHLSDDEKLKGAFTANEDIHKKTASEVFDVPLDEVTPSMRGRAKAVNFGIIYGISDFGLSRNLNISRKEAKKYIDSYFEKYGKVKEFMDNLIKEGKENGYVKTLLNRRRYLPELKSRNYNVRSFGERMAMNTPIQGSAADIIKVAMVNVYRELKKRKMKSRLILQVHDELIIEAHKDEVDEVKKLLKDLMENAIKLNVPLKVDMKTGDSWYETK
ncbi:DNA polymerase I [Thermohalobacter berrensis]|uniref:DNA polymerase I n=1 Tax=Thermohalobacter berrensis TaxID=99594 RepID=A0A419T6S0_9FIRM|nr:DNA polymerase I [Thermohalobacter berrensis]RKD33171.1 DNA polymerase I [Thermohalobacter berrensis]